MNNNIAKIVLLGLALIILAAALYIYRPVQNRFTRITVLGDSQTKIAPDTAVITFSVVTQNSQAVNAQQENARKSEAVKQAVQNLTQNTKTEIKTDNYTLNPKQDYNYGKMPKIIGYEVKNSVTVSLSDLTKVGEVIDAATKAGANSVEGIQFIVGETSPAQGGALSLATKQALTKAEAIAESMNGKIVRILETREGGAPDLPREYNYSAYANTNSSVATDFKRAATPVQAGKLDMRAQVVMLVEVETKN